MIYTDTSVFGGEDQNVTQVPDPSVVAGLAWRFPACDNMDTAMVEYMLLASETVGNPVSD